jgi:hypothetical protein
MGSIKRAPMKCRSCSRQVGDGYWRDSAKSHFYIPVCSLSCLELYSRIRKLDGLSENEIAAIEAASAPAGEYLESIGVFDFRKMTQTQWMNLLECVTCTALDTLAELSIKQIPFPELVSEVEKSWKK